MNQSRTISLPVHVVKELNSIMRAMRELGNHLASESTIGNVAFKLKIPVEDVRLSLNQNERLVSLDAPPDMDPALSIGESIQDDKNFSPDAMIEESERNTVVRNWLMKLNANQRTVIEMRFGFNGREIRTLEELSQHLGLIRERIRQIQNEALRLLRAHAANKGISKEMVL